MQLRYAPGAADPVPYHDEDRAAKYYPGTHDVSEAAAEEYLEDGGWEPVAVSPANFDAAAFRDQHWSEIVETIKAGDVDDRLEDIRAAERSRQKGSGARPSVLSAIDSRLTELTTSETGAGE